STSNQFSGYVQSYFSNAVKYFHLGTENELLVKENARLQNEVLNLEQKLDHLQSRPEAMELLQQKDSIPNRFRVVPAQVISNSFSSLYNFITIDVGSQSGIR